MSKKTMSGTMYTPIFKKKPRQPMFAQPSNNADQLQISNSSVNSSQSNTIYSSSGICNTGQFSQQPSTRLVSKATTHPHVAEPQGAIPKKQNTSVRTPQTQPPRISQNTHSISRERHLKRKPGLIESTNTYGHGQGFIQPPIQPQNKSIETRQNNNPGQAKPNSGNKGMRIQDGPHFKQSADYTHQPPKQQTTIFFNALSPVTGGEPHGHPSVPHSSQQASHVSQGNSYPQPAAGSQFQANSRETPNLLFKMQTVDKSLRILTSTMEGMKHWAQYKDRQPLMFEVLGTLNSAMISRGSDCKMFQLKDNKDTVNCVFYEIDRTLARFTRGQMLRCMGALDSKGVMKVVSVRPATNQERSIQRLAVSHSDGVMRKCVANT